LLPQTGSLAFLGPPTAAGVDLAIKEINSVGGVLGKPVTQVKGDSGDTTTDIGSETVDRLLAQNVDAIIGAVSNGVSATVIDKITAAGVLQMSPANTSNLFTDYQDNGLYFRTAPSDRFQGRAVGDLMLADGANKVAILAIEDPYGSEMAEAVTESVTAGGGQVVATKTFSSDGTSLSTAISAIKASRPDAIALISFNEVKKFIPEMIDQDLSPKKVYLFDGNLADYSKDFAKGTLTGVKGALQGVVTSAGFQKRLLALEPDLTEFSYAPESFDAMVLVALAAETAKDNSGASIASKLVEVSKGGARCISFEACRKLIKAGTDVDYDGVSGPIDYSDNGDVGLGRIGIYQYGSDNTYTYLKSLDVTL
jgi:ABC-type branched-subunit amino acid transport system substrate-binding protein